MNFEGPQMGKTYRSWNSRQQYLCLAIGPPIAGATEKAQGLMSES